MKLLTKILFLCAICLSVLLSTAQNKTATTATVPSKPKLVIGLVVDQMRWDYLYRYSEKYSAGGFKRLLKDGYSCENTHINYSPSYTACGHTCVYTGSVPTVHGITGNDWYSYTEDSAVYCVRDTRYNTIGSTSLQTGKVSPRNLLTTTITDELKLATNFKAKTIGIALKDRSSVLPAGHKADAAYFYDGSLGNWVTSSYYMNQLPAWVFQFNTKKYADSLLAKAWSPLLSPITAYTESEEDFQVYEDVLDREKSPVFIHRVDTLTKPVSKILPYTPYGNTLTLDFAKAAISNENLGTKDVTDFLAVSLSSTDIVGHKFGPNSIEVEDCYLRLDKDLEKFFSFLDTRLGKGNYLLFLTADHGAAHIPDFMKKNKMPAGVFPLYQIDSLLETAIKAKFSTDSLILGFENMQMYLNNERIAKKNINRAELKTFIKNFSMQFDGVAKVLDMENLSNELMDADMKQAIANGYYPQRSGDLYLLLEPGWFEQMKKGTTHGTIYPYDTHIPLVWMGWNIKHAEDHTDVHMTDITPTLAALLHIQEPSGCTGKVIEGIFKK